MKTARAFTLIELLGVIAVIAILVAISLSALTKARSVGQRARISGLAPERVIRKSPSRRRGGSGGPSYSAVSWNCDI